MHKLSYRRLFAWAVLCCTLSSLCGLGRSLALGCVIGGIFAGPLITHWYRCAATASSSLTIIIARVILLLLPCLSFIYAGHFAETQKGNAKKSVPTINRYCGKKVVLVASIDRVIAQQTPAAQILSVNCISISFPEERAAQGHACLVINGSSCASASQPLTGGELVSVACYLRSSRFSVVKASSQLEHNCPYFEQHKRNFDVFSFVSPQDVRALSRLSDSMSSEQNVLIAAQHFIQPFISFCREQITDNHKQILGSDNGALLTSMVLGQNAVDLPKNIIDSFRDVGLSHIVAASGFNLTIVILVTYWLLRPLHLPGNGCEYACLAMMVLYIALAGLSPSIGRAALMSTFVLLSRMTQRRIFIGSALAAAMVLTWLPSPQALSDVGLQLSYVATIGIIAGAKSLGQLLNSSPNRFLQKCADLLAVTLVAQLSVLPIQLYYFGTIGLMFLPANLLVVPFVTLVTQLGFLSSLLILIGSINPFCDFFVLPLVTRIDQFLQFPLKFIVWVTSSLSSVQFAKLHIEQPSINAIAIYYACIVSSLFLLRFPDKKLAVLAFVILAIVCLILLKF